MALRAGLPRVETGIVQFDDDWPGIFIRGDNAVMYAYALGHPGDPVVGSYVDALMRLLASANVQNHTLNERQVISRARGDE